MTHCPTCGSLVTVIASRDGTAHYEPDAELDQLRSRLRDQGIEIGTWQARADWLREILERIVEDLQRESDLNHRMPTLDPRELRLALDANIAGERPGPQSREAVEAERLRADRDRMIRAFNRLEKAVSNHIRDCIDAEALEHAHHTIMRSVSAPTERP
jgi:hypothetical protein